MQSWQISAPPPVEHRWLGFDRRYLPGTLAVLLLVILWSAIVPAIDESFRKDALAAGTVLEIGRTGVTFTPTPGWLLAGVSLPADQQLTIFGEGVTFGIRVGGYSGTSLGLLNQIRDLHRDFTVEGEVRSFTLPEGTVGSAVQIFGTNFSGGLFAFVSGGRGIQVTVKGPPEVLPQQTKAIGLMIASLRFNQDGGQK